MIRKRTLYVTLGAAAAGTAIAAASLRVALGRGHRCPDAHCEDDFGELEGAVHQSVSTDDGGEIHVVERGQGRPFVLLAGVTMTTLCWQYQLVDLVDAGYRVIAVDIRGHGRSHPGRDGYGIGRLAEDVHQVLRALDVRDAMVVGHSLGGMTTLQLLDDHPELGRDGTVSGIVLASTSAGMLIGNGVPAAFARMACRFTPAAGRAHGFAAARRSEFPRPGGDLSTLYCRLAFGAGASRTHVEVVRAMTSAVAADVLSPLIATLMSLDLRNQLADISVPTLVVVGGRDMITPVWHSRYLASHIPGAEIVVLPGAGHHVLLERRAEVADLLVGWAERCRGGGPDSWQQRQASLRVPTLPVDRSLSASITSRAADTRSS